MDLNYVNAGEPIKALTMNSLIDAVLPFYSQDGEWIQDGTTLIASPGGSDYISPYIDEDSSQLRPFTCINRKNNNDQDTWYMYTPPGCLTMNGSNGYCSNTSADLSNLVDWVELETPNDRDADIRQYGNLMYKTWNVKVNVMPCGVYEGVTSADSIPQVSSFNACMIRDMLTEKEGGGYNHVYSVVDLDVGAKTYRFDDPASQYGLFFEAPTSLSEKNDPSKYKLKMLNITTIWGPKQLSCDPTEITDFSNVVLKITHADPEELELEIVNQKGQDTRDNTFITLLQYDKSKQAIMSDLRSTVRAKSFPYYITT